MSIFCSVVHRLSTTTHPLFPFREQYPHVYARDLALRVTVMVVPFLIDVTRPENVLASFLIVREELTLYTQPVISLAAGFTVTVQVAFLLLLATEVQVMVAVPALTALTTPLLTVATAVLLLDQVTLLLVALDGDTVAVRVADLPDSRVRELLFSFTLDIEASALYDFEAVAVEVEPDATAVIGISRVILRPEISVAMSRQVYWPGFFMKLKRTPLSVPLKSSRLTTG